MILEDFFERPEMEYPIRYSGDFVNNLCGILDSYRQSVSAIKDPAFIGLDKNLANNCNNLSQTICEALEIYPEGLPSKAYSRFVAGMLKIERKVLSPYCLGQPLV